MVFVRLLIRLFNVDRIFNVDRGSNVGWVLNVGIYYKVINLDRVLAGRVIIWVGA